MDRYLIVVNCFYSVIKCYSPSVFHLIFTFQLYGLRAIHKVLDCPYALVFKRKCNKVLNGNYIKIATIFSKLLFSFLVRIRGTYDYFKYLK